MAASPSAAPTLLFVPDISGFTQFVNETEIDHSRHIIAELLEVLIDADTLGLTVSEVEGDAILFYKEGAAPDAADLLGQVEAMYAAFHTHLKRYEHQRICQCGACSTAVDLELKFVAHHGVVARENVKDHSKLFGRDVILVHRLLKNEVPLSEYALFTEGFGVDRTVRPWAVVERGSEEYDLGTVAYDFLPLAPLRKLVPEPSVQDFALPGGVLIMEVAQDIEAPLSTVFNALSDLSFRHEWQPGLVGSDRQNHAIAQGGSTHRCVIKNNGSDPFWVAHDFEASPDHVTFTETDQRYGLANVFVLRKRASSETRVEVYSFLRSGRMKRLAFRLLLKRKILASVQEGLGRLQAYCEGLAREGHEHPTGIALEPGGN